MSHSVLCSRTQAPEIRGGSDNHIVTAYALAIAGYALLMLSNPVRGSLRDGWLCIRKYPAIWKTLAWLGCANALFHAIVRISAAWRGGPQVQWARPGGSSPDSAPVLWNMPADGVVQSIQRAWIPAIESVAGLFNIAVTTFPIAVFAAAGFLLNRHRHFTILRASLRRRFGFWHWPMIAGIAICAAAVFVKAAYYLSPPEAPDENWFRRAQIVVLLASLWEYLFGLAVQVFLILHAFAWVRGITFNRDALEDLSIRRFASGAKWAAIVMILGLLLIELPQVLANYPSWQWIFPNDPQRSEARLSAARICIGIVMIAFSSMQAWLALHGETLGRAFAAHWDFLKRNAGIVTWFVLIAAVHFWLLSFGRATILAGFGENTALGVTWTIAWPWIAGPISGWLLASWVCLFKKASG